MQVSAELGTVANLAMIDSKSKVEKKQFPFVLLLKSPTVDGLEQLSRSIEKELIDHPEDLETICLESIRSSIEKSGLCWAVAGFDFQSMLAELRKRPIPTESSQDFAGNSKASETILFIFSGHGNPLNGSWHNLYRCSAIFSSSLDQICAEAKMQYGLDLHAALCLSNGDGIQIPDNVHLQAAIFALQFALCETWKSCGVTPDSVLGHSLGEYGAAVAAQALSWKEGLALVTKRASLMDSLPKSGSMMAVKKSEEDVRDFLSRNQFDLEIACVNSPVSTVLSGGSDEISKAETAFRNSRIITKILGMSQAFHSKAMAPIHAQFAAIAESICANISSGSLFKETVASSGQGAPNLSSTGEAAVPKFMSAMHARWMDRSQLRKGEYWAAQMGHKVQFMRALQIIDRENKPGMVVEIGPGSDLLPLVSMCLSMKSPRQAMPSLKLPGAEGVGTAFARTLSAVLSSPSWTARSGQNGWKIFMESMLLQAPSMTTSQARTLREEMEKLVMPQDSAATELKAGFNSSLRMPSWWKQYSSCTTLVSAGKMSVQEKGDAAFMTWLDEKGAETAVLTYKEVWRRSGAIATKLERSLGLRRGDRAMMCYSPGPEFFVAFWGVIAVPVYPPNPAKLKIALKKMDHVKDACGARVCLTDSAVNRARIVSSITETWPKGLQWVSTDGNWAMDSNDSDAALNLRDPDPQEVAFLQFTSGSTGDPKGVVIQHSHLWHNINDIIIPSSLHAYRTLGFDYSTREMVCVSWLPQYHDLGLIGLMLASFVARQRYIGFSPMAFLSNPILWASAMSKYRASTSAGPNFAFGYLAKRLNGLKDRDKRELSLDLRNLVMVASGGERVRREDIDAFSTALSPFGYRGAVLPVFGMAEHCVFVTWHVDAERNTHTAKGKRSQFVSCGKVVDFIPVLKIVDADNFVELEDGKIGEVWLSSGSVAGGYWGNSILTTDVFKAKIRGDQRHFLRTGDEGFIEDGHFYLCGRIKDMIIVAGRNYYPDDIEASTAQAAPEVVRPGCIAAFMDDNGEKESCIIVFEVRDGVKVGDSPQKIIAAVVKEVGITPSRIIAIRSKCIPKTTSGKIQRKATRDLLFQRKLPILFDSLRHNDDDKDGDISHCSSGCIPFFLRRRQSVGQAARKDYSQNLQLKDQTPPNKSQFASERIDWVASLRLLPAEKREGEIRHKISSILKSIGIESSVPDGMPWGDAGLDSLGMVELQTRLDVDLGESLKLSSTAMFDYPTLDALVHHINISLFPQISCHKFDSFARIEPIAVVGMACRFGNGIDSTTKLWEFLQSRRDAVREIPLERMDWRRSYLPNIYTGERKMYTNRAAMIDAAQMFDHHRFGINLAEAKLMDPQQRIALEVAHEALLQSKIGLESSERRAIGTFVGQSSHDFSLILSRAREHTSPYVGTGVAASIIANRLAYLYGFSAMSTTIDTACSSSLVALDAACKAIFHNDCKAAVVVGINLMLTVDAFEAFCSAKMLSPNGRCATFSDAADGYARGEGCGAVVLKPLSRALADGDSIWGVVHGAAINQDGKTATLTAPNGPSQVEVIKSALNRAGILPTDISYIEAHGTGTPLGDPIEVNALAQVFQGRTVPLVVGAIKPNLGHLEAAAGIAGLIKALLCMVHKQVPANIHCETLNPRLREAAEKSLLQFPKESVSLKSLFAGISSFGFGGTNAHVVVGSSPKGSVVPEQPEIGWQRVAIPWMSDQNGILGSATMNGDTHVWTNEWDESMVLFLSDHKVRSTSLVPGVFFLELVAPAVAQVYGNVPYALQDVNFEQGLPLDADSRPIVRLSMHPVDGVGSDPSKESIVRIQSLRGRENWVEHVSMRLFVGVDTPKEIFDVEAAITRCGEMIPCGESFYATIGNLYEGEFRSLQSVWRGQNESVGRILVDENATVPGYLRQSALLESVVHIGMERLDPSERQKPLYASALESFIACGVERKASRVAWGHWESSKNGKSSHITMYDSGGHFLARMEGLKIGSLEVDRRSILTVDEWIARSTPPYLEASVERVKPSSILELHSMILARIEVQAPLCILVASNDFASEVFAYIRTVRTECTEWALVVVYTSEEIAGSPTEWAEGDWKLENGFWSVRRLRWAPPQLPLVAALKTSGRGQLTNLKVVEAQRISALSGYIELRVLSAVVSQRDIQRVLGIQSDDARSLGSDCAGVIVSVGTNVSEFQVGDRVYGVVAGAFETYVTARTAQIRKIPQALTIDEASALPIPMTAAFYALLKCSKLCKAQRVLVHDGTSAVGLAAIHYSHLIGCDVVAVANSAADENYLQKIGVSQIVSREDLEAFTSTITSIKPFDIVLTGNSSTIAQIKNSIDILKPCGSFCDVRTHVLEGINIEERALHLSAMLTARHDIHYHLIDIYKMVTESLDTFQQLFGESEMYMLSEGKPVIPYNSFAFEHAVEAFKQVKESPFIGTTLLTQNLLFDEHKTYLISGGLGYIGRLMACAMIEHGARKLVLLSSSRSTLPDDWNLSVRPDVVKCNVSNIDELQLVFGKYKEIRGVVHAAGVLSDGIVQTLEPKHFAVVYEPKIRGAQNLAQCIGERPMDFFMLCSSMSSAFGGPGESNYAAANGCLDALAQQLFNQGRTVLSVQLGAWLGGGMAKEAIFKRMARKGMLPLSPDIGIETMLRLIKHKPNRAIITACPLNPRKVPPAPLFSEIVISSGAQQSDSAVAGGGEWVGTLRLLDVGERNSAIRSKIAELLKSIGVDSVVSGSAPWEESGLDSLSMVELRNLLRQTLGGAISLSTTALFDFQNLDDLVMHIENSLFPPT